jgi:DNA-binding beta-propeller fold protein YncE
MKNKIIFKTILIFFIVQFFGIISFGQQIYFVDNQSTKVQKSDNDGSNLKDLTASSLGLYGIATDITNSKIYFTNVVTDEILIAGLDGSSPTVLLNSSDGIDGPRGIAIDGVNNKIYWAEVISGKIKSADLDGTNVADVVIGLSSPVDVALDLVYIKLYWSDNGVGQKKIIRSNLDGTSPEDIITSLDQVGGIEVDAESGKLYWIDFGATDKISRANLDGTSPEVLRTITSGSPRGIVIDKENDKLFWSDVLSSTISAANRDGTGSSTILSGLSYPIGISTNWTSALPVELTTFSASIFGNSVNLNWETATEVNNYGFEIERASTPHSMSSSRADLSATAETRDWEKIGFVNGHGNSHSPKIYKFEDQSTSSSGKYKYRLKQIDIDGKYEYSQIIEVEVDIPTEFELAQNYPNPFNPTTTIAFSIPVKGNVTVQVFNMLGEVIETLVNQELDPGKYNYDFDATALSSGTYIYRISAGTNVEVRKMILLK